MARLSPTVRSQRSRDEREARSARDRLPLPWIVIPVAIAVVVATGVVLRAVL